MTHSYVDLNTIHSPATGTVAPAAWGDAIRDNQDLFIDPPACSVFHSTTQSVATGVTFTTLSANSETFDNDSMHSTVSATSRITIQTAGRYLFIAVIDFGTNATSVRGIRFITNGTGIKDLTHCQASADLETILSGSRMITLTAGEYVEVQCRHGAGTNLNVELHEFACTFLTR